MTRESTWPTSLALALVIAVAAANVGLAVFIHGRAQDARDLRPNPSDEVAVLLDGQRGSSQRRVFGLYQLIDHHLDDGAVVDVALQLRGHLFWLRHTGAVNARVSDRPLELDAAQAAAARAAATIEARLGDTRAWCRFGTSSESHVLAIERGGGADVFVMPATIFDAIGATR